MSSAAHLMADKCFASQEAGSRLCLSFGCSSQPGGSAGSSSEGTWSEPGWLLSFGHKPIKDILAQVLAAALNTDSHLDSEQVSAA